MAPAFHFEVLAYMAKLLDSELSVKHSAKDEYGQDISLPGIAYGSTHDDCFFHVVPASTLLKRALLESVLALHSSYLQKEVDWSAVIDPILRL